MSNAPTVLMGLVPLIRAVVRSAATGTLTTTVTADDSGTLFISLTTGTNNYVLPTVALGAGKHWWFFNGETTNVITITGGTASVMMVNDSVIAKSAASAGAVGDSCLVVCDGTYYYVLAAVGTWTKTD